MTVLQTLERLPMSRPQWRLLFQGGLGYTFDGMDEVNVPVEVEARIAKNWGERS